MTNKKKIIIGAIAVIVVVVTFIAGMEYKAYQIRSVLGEALSEVSDVFGGNVDDEKTIKSENTEASNDLNNKISLEILKKGFYSGDWEDQITMTFKFTNNTNKDIEGIKGMVYLNDFFGDSIQSISVSYDEGIKAGESKLYNAGLEYNQFIDEDNKLRQTSLEKMKYEWAVDTIIYSDGTIENI